MNRDDAYMQLLGAMALAYPGEHKGAQATARALLDSPEALRGAYAVAGLCSAFHASLIDEGLEDQRAAAHTLAMVTLIEYVIGNMLDDDVATRFPRDYDRAAEAIS